MLPFICNLLKQIKLYVCMYVCMYANVPRVDRLPLLFAWLLATIWPDHARDFWVWVWVVRGKRRARAGDDPAHLWCVTCLESVALFLLCLLCDLGGGEWRCTTEARAFYRHWFFFLTRNVYNLSLFLDCMILLTILSVRVLLPGNLSMALFILASASHLSCKFLARP